MAAIHSSLHPTGATPELSQGLPYRKMRHRIAKDPTAARLPYADIRQCKTNPVSPSLSSNLRAQPWVPSFSTPRLRRGIPMRLPSFATHATDTIPIMRLLRPTISITPFKTHLF